MDIFKYRDDLLGDYASYVKGFLEVQDSDLEQFIATKLEGGFLWPEPLVQLNPAFLPGPTIDDLVDQKLLDPICKQVFRRGKTGENPHGSPLRLHTHQAAALQCAQKGANYVLTTGTGSGKSLTYILPIVDLVLKSGSGNGIQAIVVYPMNALANSQLGEMEKFLGPGFPAGKPPVRFARYTGQETGEERDKILDNPPDVLLTNYVMLELILTRPREREHLIKAAGGLKYLVLDELHTYRGRQGADVAMLVRRLRETLKAKDLLFVGTSATMGSGATIAEIKNDVAAVASRLFGSTVEAENVIGESLRRITEPVDTGNQTTLHALRARVTDPSFDIPTSFEAFCKDPLAGWIETTFGLEEESGTGNLRRATPKTLDQAGRKLAEKLGIEVPICAAAIQRWLLHGYKCEPDSISGNRPFAFRLHQFISKGDAVYATIGKGDDRWLTLQPQLFRPEHREERLFPLAFCRECGQEFYSVYLHERVEGIEAVPRPVGEDDSQDDHIHTGYLMVLDEPWPSDAAQELERLPDEWKEPWKGGLRIRSDRRDHRPLPYQIGKDGKLSPQGSPVVFLNTPFCFCPSCRVTYSARQRKDFGKLATLSSEGRSTATTILSLSAIRHLKTVKTLEARARKLLSFTDNRQDASLQAGHFNDFSEIGLLRSALYQAVKAAGEQGLTHEKLSHAVFEALNLPFESFAVDPTLKFAPKEDTKQALKDILAYRLYRDLRRGWRINLPNLEQVGLLSIEYRSLEELSEVEEEWAGKHPLLVTGSPSDRRIWCRVLLDVLRRSLALKVDYLRADYQDQLKQRSTQRLKEPWGLDEDEKLDRATLAFPRQREKSDDTYRDSLTFVGPRSSFGQFLRREAGRIMPGLPLKSEDLQEIIRQLFDLLRVAGLLEIRENGEVPGYQIPADALVWKVGNGLVPHDPLLQPSQSVAPRSPNPFFLSFYRETAQHLLGLQAREHTAQVPSRQREERESDFREGKLKILYCSPTMELGVDISDLNVVNLRNVPPTPANYAQRSGRAGRSGQPALVYTYCSTGSSHDQYFFRRPERMVSGRVATPRLDLANEDLIRSHIHAIWLSETQVDLKRSLRDILDLEGENPSLNILPSVSTQMGDPKPKERTRVKAQAILDELAEELKVATWYTPEWLDRVLNQLSKHFEGACERWRTMYRSARNQQEIQNKIILDHTRSPKDHEKAKRQRREAEAQLKLLCESENLMQSDFYSYRYFASEGFLPGYNFPRLPLSAFIPGRRQVREKEGEEFLSRPRFLAISEFGPRAIVYHEGSRYEINKVILPVGDGPVLGQMKRCQACGYLHSIPEGQPGPDICEHCGQSLGMPRSNMFRLQNVSTRRRERINSDEEERFRKGFDLQTAIRFEERGGKPSPRKADLYEGTTPLAVLHYGDAATIWRVNLGMRRRDITKPDGFILDLERGLWESQERLAEAQETNGDSEDMSGNVARVIPYVEDRRNCLLFTPFPTREPAFMASLQAALKNAIQVCFQLEDSELACEPLPSGELRTQILIYESAEGGAGVLRRLVADGQTSLIEVARTALDLLHFDPDSGEDLQFPKGSKEACEAACYDCLMSYGNQWDHELLDRHLIKDYLMAMSRGTLKVSSSAKSREDHLQGLIAQCESKLEKDWLRFLYEKELRLPTRAQVFFKSCMTRPDFLFDEHQAVVYVDGPPHDFPERQNRDQAQTTSMEDAGFQVIRFHHADNWNDVVKKYPSVFGSLA